MLGWLFLLKAEDGGGSSTLNVWSSTGSTNGNLGTNWSLGSISPTDTLMFNATSVVNCTLSASLSVASIDLSTGYTGTISCGAHSVTTTSDQTWNIGLGGTVNFGSATITCGGNFDWSGAAGTITPGTSTVVLTGGGTTFNAPTSSSPSRRFYGLTIQASGTVTQGSSVAGTTFTLTSGTLTTGCYNITTTGNFTIGASGQVTAASLAGATWTVGGNLSLTGESGDLLTLNPSSAWTLTVTGTASANYVSAANSDARGGSTIIASNSTSGGNNLNWMFQPAAGHRLPRLLRNPRARRFAEAVERALNE